MTSLVHPALTAGNFPTPALLPGARVGRLSMAEQPGRTGGAESRPRFAIAARSGGRVDTAATLETRARPKYTEPVSSPASASLSMPQQTGSLRPLNRPARGDGLSTLDSAAGRFPRPGGAFRIATPSLVVRLLRATTGLLCGVAAYFRGNPHGL